jgi:hypothetical protein
MNQHKNCEGHSGAFDRLSYKAHLRSTRIDDYFYNGKGHAQVQLINIRSLHIQGYFTNV